MNTYKYSLVVSLFLIGSLYGVDEVSREEKAARSSSPVTAKLGLCLKRGRTITFYDENNERIGYSKRYSGDLDVKSYQGNKLNNIDLSNLKSVSETKIEYKWGVLGWLLNLSKETNNQITYVENSK